jgi:hypothetical protein
MTKTKTVPVLKPVHMFATPENWPELERWLMGLTGAERAVATTAALMAWNLAAKIVNEGTE